MDKEISLTTEEQQIYDLLSDTGKNLYHLMHLQQQHEMGKLQDLTEAVREVRAHQEKRGKFFEFIWILSRKYLGYIIEFLEKIKEQRFDE